MAGELFDSPNATRVLKATIELGNQTLKIIDSKKQVATEVKAKPALISESEEPTKSAK